MATRISLEKFPILDEDDYPWYIRIHGVSDGDRKKIFFSDKYEDYASVSWFVSLQSTKEDYVRRLAQFYQILMQGNFKPADVEKEFLGIKLISPGPQLEHEDLPLEFILDGGQRVVERPNFPKATLLRINSTYADFSLECYTKEWNLEHASLAVITHQDLSVPVSELIADTCRHPVEKEALQPALAEIYTFS
ncbi:MAG: hypothetical protein V1743_01295 [Nanoarchaeota archaeon]